MIYNAKVPAGCAYYPYIYEHDPVPFSRVFAGKTQGFSLYLPAEPILQIISSFPHRHLLCANRFENGKRLIRLQNTSRVPVSLRDRRSSHWHEHLVDELARKLAQIEINNLHKSQIFTEYDLIVRFEPKLQEGTGTRYAILLLKGITVLQ